MVRNYYLIIWENSLIFPKRKKRKTKDENEECVHSFVVVVSEEQKIPKGNRVVKREGRTPRKIGRFEGVKNKKISNERKGRKDFFWWFEKIPSRSVLFFCVRIYSILFYFIREYSILF